MNFETKQLAVKPEEAFKMLGIGRSLGYNLINSGQLPSVRLGRRLLVPISGLERLLENQKNA